MKKQKESQKESRNYSAKYRKDQRVCAYLGDAIIESVLTDKEECSAYNEPLYYLRGERFSGYHKESDIERVTDPLFKFGEVVLWHGIYANMNSVMRPVKPCNVKIINIHYDGTNYSTYTVERDDGQCWIVYENSLSEIMEK